jgi:hypothetical protein
MHASGQFVSSGAFIGGWRGCPSGWIPEFAGALVRAAAAWTESGPRTARLRAGLVAWAPFSLGVAMAALVCYPFVGGRLLLLDFASGPHEPLLPAAAFGFDGGLTGGVPLALGVRLLDRVLGQAGSVVQWAGPKAK